MEFYFPTELGERLAFIGAAGTVVFGLLIMLAPGLAMSFLGLQPREPRNQGFSEVRSTGGFYVGCGLSAILLAQDWIYLTLGAAFAFSAFARILSLMSDGANEMRNYLLLVVQIALAFLPLSYVFQLF
ncbi:DUF4345 family protein [Ciceribacter sp. L1K23]|uniref:AGROH133_08824 family phage infection protein n=1 Tax=Ciceribacter sp. L1K23 TaxID=2820276 RepID=UPI001B84365D|nr:DUF4345 family protein [Ciceribacter sp. L1K23]